MSIDLCRIFSEQHGVATSAQILAQLSRRSMQSQLRTGQLVKVWPGIYTDRRVDDRTRLYGLDLRVGEPVAACLATAARVYGFDTEEITDLHVLNPVGHLLRSSDGLVVHRRNGAPLSTVRGRLLTTPAWTAVEVARGLTRPRALATLDAALRSRRCDRRALLDAADQQKGRRGIAQVNELLPLATHLAESPMESEARLVMHDGGLPAPELQYRIRDRDGRSWRVDFAWPDALLAVEYDSYEFHSDIDDFRRDRRKHAALQEMRWTVITLVADDVRRTPSKTVRRIGATLIHRGPASAQICTA